MAIVDGEAVFYLERGGRTTLVFTDDVDVLAAAAVALAAALAPRAHRAHAHRDRERRAGVRLRARPAAARRAASARRRGGSGSMPEGDTVYRAARSLDAALAGRVVTSSDLRVPAYATVDLSGETCALASRAAASTC